MSAAVVEQVDIELQLATLLLLEVQSQLLLGLVGLLNQLLQAQVMMELLLFLAQ